MSSFRYNYSYSPINSLRKNYATPGETRFLVGLLIILIFIIASYLALIYFAPIIKSKQDKKPLEKPVVLNIPKYA